VYNFIRVLIAAYVWMTGFGNFSFFWVRGDYSIRRMLKMLFRLNFFVTLLCITLSRQYMLYYICALHTWWFLVRTCYILMLYFKKKKKQKKNLCVCACLQFSVASFRVCAALSYIRTLSAANLCLDMTICR
jgi:hypothetical protein